MTTTRTRTLICDYCGLRLLRTARGQSGGADGPGRPVVAAGRRQSLGLLGPVPDRRPGAGPVEHAGPEVSATGEPERASGRCRDCGGSTTGKLVAYIDQSSGPGLVLIVCDPCAADPPKARASERPRTYTR